MSDGAVTPARVVAIANGTYAALRPLERAVPDTTRLAELLRDDHGFEAVVLADVDRSVVIDRLEDALEERSLAKGALIVLWTGHGDINEDRTLSLVGRSAERQRDVEIVAAARLGFLASKTGASQVLIVLDTCYSAAGILDAATAATAVFNARADDRCWFCVVASAGTDEPARSGALADHLARLLIDGPSSGPTSAWNQYDSHVRGDLVVHALLNEWSEERHTPRAMNYGLSWPMLRNPLHRPRARHQVVEHLRQAARSTSGDGSFFTGRQDQLERLVALLRRGQPGLAVVTGPAGSGKSAIVGRLVSLSDPDEGDRLRRAGGIAASVDPGDGSVDAHLHARGHDVKAAIAALADQLDLPAGASVYDLLALANRRRIERGPLVIVLDGLDEAGEVEAPAIAAQLVEPLAREAIVLVATREVPGAGPEPGLLALLGPAADLIDLGADANGTLTDVHEYVVRRLTDTAAAMDPAAVADEVTTIARGSGEIVEGPFLLARLITSQLRGAPVDTSVEGWQSSLATSVTAALEDDLRSTVLTVDGTPQPGAARDLMRALACAYGNGMPIDDVWPDVATALSAGGTPYTRADAEAVLDELGRHVVAGAEGGQAVYRVAHQLMVDHLRPTTHDGLRRRLSPVVAEPIATAIAATYERLLDAGQDPRLNTYLWRHAWRHLADAGTMGIELLRRFEARDPDSFAVDLALGLGAVGDAMSFANDPVGAIPLLEESVELRRRQDDPLALAMSLFNLAVSLAAGGESGGADAAAAEAASLARTADDPAQREVLAAALVGRALTQLRLGNGSGALRSASEAIALLEDVPAGDGRDTTMLSAALTIATLAAAANGDLAIGEAHSARAIDLIDDEPPSESIDTLLSDALAARAEVELQLILAGEAPLSAPSTAQRIIELSRRAARRGTMTDLAIASGLRLAALITILSGGVEGVDPVELLDEAVELVREPAATSVEAANAYGACLLTRSQLTGGDRAIDDLLVAEQTLRRHTATAPVARVQLGECLHLLVAARLAAGAQPADLVAQQVEAVEHLAAIDIPRALDRQIDARIALVEMLRRVGRTDDAIREADIALELMARVTSVAPQAVRRQIALLSEQAGTIFGRRPFEAAAFADEALALMDANPDVMPAHVRGAVELNRGVALMAMREMTTAGDVLADAVAELEVVVAAGAPPIVTTWLGLALNNLAVVGLETGQPAAAAAHAERAIASLIGATTGVEPWLVHSARVTYGRALRLVGQGDAGDNAVSEGVAGLLADRGTDLGALQALALGLNAAGAPAWDAALADFAAQPEDARLLRLLRDRGPDAVDVTVAELVGELAAAADDDEFTVSIHEAARERRRRDPARFDALWRQATGDVPSWLEIDPRHSALVAAWWNAPSWARSKQFLHEHPELLDPSSDVALGEIGAAVGRADILARHLEILVAARGEGLDAAYEPVLALELVVQWLDAADDQRFLAEHLDELLTPAIDDAIGELDDGADEGDASTGEVLRAVLQLARRGESVLAYRLLDEPSAVAALLGPAAQSPDTERLAALARLILANDTTSARDRQLAVVAYAVARAREGDGEAAVDVVADGLEDADDDERGELRAFVAGARQADPAHAAELDELRAALEATT